MSLVQMSFSGAMMILAIMLTRIPAINRLPKKVFILLWEAVLLRLLIPFSIPTMWSAYSFIKRQPRLQESLTQTPVANLIPQAVENRPVIDVGAFQPLQNHTSEVFDWSLVLPVLWIVGVILCISFFVVAYLRCYFEFRTSLPVQNLYVNEWLEEHRLVRSIQIRQSDSISTPLTYGIFKPVILLPKKTEWENEQQMQYVLQHEYMHIRRLDSVRKLVTVLAICVHWFNPAVWGMYILFNRDIELACDESVVRQFGEKSRSTYARTLINMEEKRSGLIPLGNNFSKNAIEKRITAIMKTKKITMWAITVSAVILAAVIILFATSSKSEAASNARGEEDIADEEMIDGVGILAAGIDVPDVVLEAAINYTEQAYDASVSYDMSLSNEETANYSNWKIESLEHVYTYEDFEGLTLQVYEMQHALLANHPENIDFAGGMSVDEEGWVRSGWRYYFIYKQEGDTLTYLFITAENDCYPGDEVFTWDVRNRLQILMGMEIAPILQEFLMRRNQWEDNYVLEPLEPIVGTIDNEKVYRFELRYTEDTDDVGGRLIADYAITMDGFKIFQYNPADDEWVLSNTRSQ